MKSLKQKQLLNFTITYYNRMRNDNEWLDIEASSKQEAINAFNLYYEDFDLLKIVVNNNNED
jgi:hypothetical protein